MSTLRSLLTAEDAVTKTSCLPILNVEGNSMHDMAALHIMLYNYYMFCVSTKYLYTIHPFVVPWRVGRYSSYYLFNCMLCYLIQLFHMQPWGHSNCTQANIVIYYISYVLSHMHSCFVSGTCHPCPSYSQTTSVSEQMFSSVSNDGSPKPVITVGTSSGGMVY